VKFRNYERIGTIIGRHDSAPQKRLLHRPRLNAADHLAECAVQPAEFALERGIALVLVMGCAMVAGVPRRMHERTLLREQQEKGTGDSGC
jgi:hypothetical protein